MEFRARHGVRAPATVLATLAVALMLLIAPPASAVKITEFPTGLTSEGLTSEGYISAGPDGNMWFTFVGQIARITPAGVVTAFSKGIIGGPQDITTGPGGDLWFSVAGGKICSECSAQGTLGRITPTGVVTEFCGSMSVECFPFAPLFPSEPARRITTGAEGDLYVTIRGCCLRSAPTVYRMTPELTVTRVGLDTTVLHTWSHDLNGITLGREGDLWVSEGDVNWLARVSPEGVDTEFPIGGELSCGAGDITTGPEGNLWFTVGRGYGNECPGGRIGRMTPTGTVTEFSTGITGQPDQITVGPDHNMWFTESAPSGEGGWIGRITPKGTVTEFSKGITPGARPFAITAGPHGSVWFTETTVENIGRVKP